MIRCEKDGVVWLQFELLSQFPNLKHGVFLKHGGFSSGDYSSLNISYKVGDSNDAVTKNRKKIQQSLGIERLASALQVHGSEVQEVVPSTVDTDRTCDGMVTNVAGVGLMVSHADCQAAIFYDPIKKVLANVHSGWRGSVKNIYRKTINTMRDLYGTDPKNLHVAISPSLGPARAEFINYKTELPQEFWVYQEKTNYFDFWEISRQQLMDCGVLSEHIEVAGICTYSNSDEYFSYRRKKVSGRHGTVASLS